MKVLLFKHLKLRLLTLENMLDTTIEEKCKFLFNLLVFHLFFSFDSVVEQFDGKSAVMTLLSHPDGNVKHQALLCIQKLMVHNW